MEKSNNVFTSTTSNSTSSSSSSSSGIGASSTITSPTTNQVTTASAGVFSSMTSTESMVSSANTPMTCMMPFASCGADWTGSSRSMCQVSSQSSENLPVAKSKRKRDENGDAGCLTLPPPSCLPIPGFFGSQPLPICALGNCVGRKENRQQAKSLKASFITEEENRQKAKRRKASFTCGKSDIEHPWKCSSNRKSELLAHGCEMIMQRIKNLFECDLEMVNEYGLEMVTECDLERVNSLMQVNKNFNKICRARFDEILKTAAAATITKIFFLALKEDFFPLRSLAFSKGIEVGTLNKEKIHYLAHYIVDEKNMDLLERIIRERETTGMNIDLFLRVQDDNGHNVLDHAFASGRKALVIKLLKHGAQDNGEKTVLMRAVAQALNEARHTGSVDLEMIRVLIDKPDFSRWRLKAALKVAIEAEDDPKVSIEENMKRKDSIMQLFFNKRIMLEGFDWEQYGNVENYEHCMSTSRGRILFNLYQ